jgi:hypothetical protein
MASWLDSLGVSFCVAFAGLRAPAHPIAQALRFNRSNAWLNRPTSRVTELQDRCFCSRDCPQVIDQNQHLITRLIGAGGCNRLCYRTLPKCDSAVGTRHPRPSPGLRLPDNRAERDRRADPSESDAGDPDDGRGMRRLDARAMGRGESAPAAVVR